MNTIYARAPYSGLVHNMHWVHHVATHTPSSSFIMCAIYGPSYSKISCKCHWMTVAQMNCLCPVTMKHAYQIEYGRSLFSALCRSTDGHRHCNGISLVQSHSKPFNSHTSQASQASQHCSFSFVICFLQSSSRVAFRGTNNR